MGAKGPFEVNPESKGPEPDKVQKEAQVYWFDEKDAKKKEIILIWIGMNFHRLYGQPSVLYLDPSNPDKGKMIFSPMEN